ncbi:hypothetical protein SUGI_0762910 [Cryptomeria japonica]|nr:hypothetical protein SUGI_0762910 [Cryptomeria japonica]
MWGGLAKLPDPTNNDAEYTAILDGLSLYKDKKLKNIDIYGDSLNVVRVVLIRNAPSLKSTMWLEGIRKVID